MEGSETFVGADTIFSALCHAWHHLFGDVETLLEPFLQRTPPFRVSSAFPHGPEGWYLIKPQRATVKWEEPKQLKKVRFVHEKAWTQWASGQTLSRDDWLIEGTFLVPKGQHPPLMVESVPHVSLDRQTNASNLYFTGEVHFRQDCGMALLVDAPESEWLDRVLSMLEWLGDAGLGGERTSGRGQFDVEDAEPSVQPGTGDGVILLSPYAPAGAEELSCWDLSKSSYNFTARRGFVETSGGGGLRRKSVSMFAEGSVLYRKGGVSDKLGRLVDVTPDAFTAHRIYRYGIPFTVTWND